jgi:hypothetical protein
MTENKPGEMIEAVSAGDLEKVERLLKNGADVNEKDMQDSNALIKAVVMKRADIAQLLLDWGADPNEKNCWSRDAYYLSKEAYDQRFKQMIDEAALRRHRAAEAKKRVAAKQKLLKNRAPKIFIKEGPGA